MLPLLAVSGAECVDALVAAGFGLHSRSEDGVTLYKDRHLVFVPDVAMLAPTELTRLLREAGLAYSDFLECLSEAPTDPDLKEGRSAAAGPRTSFRASSSR